MTKMNEQQVERDIDMVYFQYWRENSKINWKNNFNTRIGFFVFILEASIQDEKRNL